MLVQLPEPYPDELLYSVIGRYMAHLRLQRDRARSALFGHRAKPQIGLPGCLGELADRTSLSWGKTAKQIAYELTLFPYFACYLNKSRVSQCLACMAECSPSSVYARLGASSATIASRRYLAFCMQCREEDMSLYGETYWRRCHQLPGTFVCTRHEQVLSYIELPESNRFWRYMDATECTSELCDPIMSDLGSKASIAFAIAKRSCDLLRGTELVWSKDGIVEQYRAAILNQGSTYRLGMISYPDLEAAITSYYSESFLSLLGCELIGRDSWLRKALEPSRFTVRHPLRHILLQLFLEQHSQQASVLARHSRASWQCPNPYFQHEQIYTMRLHVGKARTDGVRSISAWCPCGMRFTFSRVSVSNPNLPVIDTVRRFAPSWADKLRELRASGIRIREIASLMKLPFASVKTLLSNAEPVLGLESRKLMLRARWEECLSEVPDRSRNLARRRNKSLYAELAVIDPEWLSATGTRLNRRRSMTDEQWRVRDREWAERLRATADRLLEAGSSRRVSASSIVLAAGLKLWVFSKLHHLPQCKVVLSRGA
ncbi:TnsD family Tn7-like transposition protein [Microvirga tunisiensis]